MKLECPIELLESCLKLRVEAHYYAPQDIKELIKDEIEQLKAAIEILKQAEK